MSGGYVVYGAAGSGSVAVEAALTLIGTPYRLFDGGDCVLSTFAPGLSGKAAKILERLGVELHMGVHVTDVRREGITVTPKAGGASAEFASIIRRA